MPSKKKGGRYTPKGGTTARRPPPRTPRSRPDPGPALDRRESPAWFLALIAVLWLAAALAIAVKVDALWKVVPVVIFGGVSVYYLRAAVAAVRRRQRNGP
jgi:hypothetical protein